MIAVAEYKEIEPVLVLNKTDLADPAPLEELYRKAGFSVYPVCARSGENAGCIKEALLGKTAVFTGNSGAGKSSLLNRLAPELHLTGDISRKLGQGAAYHAQRDAVSYGKRRLLGGYARLFLSGYHAGGGDPQRGIGPAVFGNLPFIRAIAVMPPVPM